MHRPHPEATEVYVTGTFDDWGKTQKLEKVGDIWEKEVELPANDTKYRYKFVVNGNWVTDHEAAQEEDGDHNVNNVLYPEFIKKPEPAATPAAAVISSAAPGSTTADLAALQPLEQTKSDVPGAFPETPMNEPDSFGVQPIAATEGIGNPQPGETATNTVDSTVTTSKEAYDNAGVDAPAPELEKAAVPEPETVSVQPIPASSGVGNPQPGDVQTNSVEDSVTTSKEDYEKAGSSAFPIAGAAVAAAGASAAAGVGLTSKNEEKKNLIPESSLPMGEDAGKGLDAGPTLQSSGPTSTTTALAGAVPLEQKRQAMVIDPEDAPVTEPAPEVPEPVKESIAEAHTSPEAAASEEAVKEKEAVEKELLAKVPTTDGAGDPAPTIAAATSETAPAPTTAPAASSESAADPTLADEPAVKMMNQNEEGTAADAVAEAPKTEVPAAEAAAPTAAAVSAPAPTPAAPASKEATKPATPAKATPTATPASAASKTTQPSSATSTPTKEKKKKNRVSAFFKKIFD
jgi:hypothetical protein